jgi:FlaA1/EpsC-like NDP-sugar epimerase
LRFNFFIDEEVDFGLLKALPLVLFVRVVFMLYFRIYAGIIRHTSLQDAVRVFYTVTLSTLLIGVINIIYTKINHDQVVLIPISIIIIDYFGTTLLMNALRFTTKILYIYITRPDQTNMIPCAIFGAGEAGLITKRKLEQYRGGEIKVVAFFDDNPRKQKNYVDGVTIYSGTRDFESVIEKLEIKELVISVQNLSRNRKQEIIEKCLALNVKVRSVPPVERWINGELSYNQIKNVKIEDLIERDTIVLDKAAIASQIKGKVIMVTGAAGSIGSEISKQLIQFHPKKLVLVDKSEVKLYELDSELHETYKTAYNNFIDINLADICDNSRMDKLFEKHRPHIVYHAAAYKHVPLMEDNPGEAIKVNVGGTKMIADLSVKYNVAKFVMVSTDKAVNPTNVMGASKRIAEIYVQSLNNKLEDESIPGHTRFITTRFGNVLGSSGSVIPRFRKQIEEGGPITVTHPDITRYFMTIPEACQLVLEAGNMGNGGEIYIFDMGNSVKIIDLAKKMIKLSGLTLGQDIQIVFTGLRPGEKIEEELLADEENTVPTYHPKIMIAQVRSYDFTAVEQKVSSLLELRQKQNEIEMVIRMKEIVPEYVSKNSAFEELDNLPKINSLEVLQSHGQQVMN